MSLSLFRRGCVVSSALVALAAIWPQSAMSSPGSDVINDRIPASSPLRRIDPGLVSCGKRQIALMDATRITTGWDHKKFPAFHVIGNTYSVGITAVTAYIVKTDDGLILIDTTFAETAPWVAESITKLGFRLEDIKIILGSHAHGDHEGGNAWMKAHAPNAKLMIMEKDAALVEQGLAGGGGMPASPPATVDRVLHDGDTVSLGDVTINVWKTAGHTPGATSYEWTTSEKGKSYRMLVVGSQQAATKLVPEEYPGIVDDQIAAWTRLITRRPDVWFGGHSWQHNNIDKYEAMLADPSHNPFVDPQGYRCLTAARAQDFVIELEKQARAARK